MMGFDINSAVHALSVWALPVLFAITLHEAAHGFVAWKKGDDTAYMLGRVTFNPLRHVDLWGTILIPAFLLLTRAPFLFGWAKPVPVNFHRLDHPRRDMVWVAAAGPAVNLALAYVSALALHLAPALPASAAGWVGQNLVNSILINLVLAVFNMIPLPPLDGGRVAVGLLPRRIAYPLARLEPMGFLIIIGLLFLLPWLGATLGVQLNIFNWLVGVPVEYLFQLITAASGH
jgi:Zn-dependent protease